jgi:hypothetical protein
VGFGEGKGSGEMQKGMSCVLTIGRHMARDEMNIITEDKWDEEIWGVENPENEDGKDGKKIPTLVFYFGQNVSTIWSILTMFAG